jgi:hypothetical protein
MMIWDAHCHLSGVPGRTPQERTDQLLTFADRLGIEKIVLCMGMQWSADPKPDDLRQQNDHVLAAVRHRPNRVFGFVYLNPNYLEASLAELERCVAKGPMVGVKLWIARHCNAPELDPIVKRASELKAPILQHTYIKITGNLPEESTPMELAELARRHPDVSFIGAHTGGDWEVLVLPKWPCASLDPSECFMAATPAAEASLRSLAKFWARTFPMPPESLFWAKTSNACSRLFLRRSESKRRNHE